MCGIAGFASAGAPIPRGSDVLERMAVAMTHRGPDDQGTWLDGSGSIGLCARRLAIQDLSPAGHQPMMSAHSGVVVAFNGEIYNVVELRRRLESEGHVFGGASDTEVVLRAYDRWGIAFLEHLRGMFAIAVWDPRDRRL